MMSHKLMVGMLAAAMIAGCGSPSATLTTSPATTDTNTALAPEAAFQGERHIMATGNAMSFDQIRAQLPEQISAADADRLLTTVDPSTIAADDAQTGFTIQQRFGRGGYGGIGRGFSRGFGSYGRGFGRGFYGGYGRSFRFFRHRNFYFPYYSYGSFYRPYYYNNYYPFLYNYSNTCYPYTYRY